MSMNLASLKEAKQKILIKDIPSCNLKLLIEKMDPQQGNILKSLSRRF